MGRERESSGSSIRWAAAGSRGQGDKYVVPAVPRPLLAVAVRRTRSHFGFELRDGSLSISGE